MGGARATHWSSIPRSDAMSHAPTITSRVTLLHRRPRWRTRVGLARYHRELLLFA